jgi:2-polyprenyl-3-methyl-5-hydroxy-6-metoxy-1,4-benzoquinol methylase
MSDTCLLCGSDRRVTLTDGTDLEYHTEVVRCDVVRCGGCGHVYVHPLPGAASVGALYPSTYYTVNPASPLFLQGAIYRHKMQRDVSRLRGLMADRAVRSIVDIGCGDGERLVRLRDAFGAGVEAIGIDLQVRPDTRDALAARGVSLHEGNVESDLAALTDAGHDLIIMSQLIEHLRDPRSALRLLRQKLRPTGRLVIETPNRGGLDHLLFRGRFWGGYHKPRHFHIFDREALRRLVLEAELTVHSRGCLPSPGFWIISLRNALGLSSTRRGRSPFEFLNFSNLLVVGAFTALDLAATAVRLPTSNQFVVAERP